MTTLKRRTRAKFFPEEDEKLRELVAEYGLHDWETIAELMPGRNPRQVRERWKHYLSSEKPHEPWTKEEDELLFEKVHELGGKWTKIAKFLNGRTDLQAKLRWQKMFSGKGRRVAKDETIAGRYVAQKQLVQEPPGEPPKEPPTEPNKEEEPGKVDFWTDIFTFDDPGDEVDIFMNNNAAGFTWSATFPDDLGLYMDF